MSAPLLFGTPFPSRQRCPAVSPPIALRRSLPASGLACRPGLAVPLAKVHNLHAGTRSRTCSRGSGSKTQATADLQAYVWGAPDGNKPWACPICHALLLVINEKDLQYNRNYVDYDNKPDWFEKENPQGKMPLIKDSDKYVSGLDSIVSYLEDKYSEPSVGKLSKGKSPSTLPETDIDGLWETYRHFVHATAADRDNDADDARAPLEHELSVVADGLKESGGKFFGKDYADATDLVLGPRLHHISVVLNHLHEGWVFPAGSELLGDYLKDIRELPSWKLTQYSDNDIIDYFNKVIQPAR